MANPDRACRVEGRHARSAHAPSNFIAHLGLPDGIFHRARAFNTQWRRTPKPASHARRRFASLRANASLAQTWMRPPHSMRGHARLAFGQRLTVGSLHATVRNRGSAHGRGRTGTQRVWRQLGQHHAGDAPPPSATSGRPFWSPVARRPHRIRIPTFKTAGGSSSIRRASSGCRRTTLSDRRSTTAAACCSQPPRALAVARSGRARMPCR